MLLRSVLPLETIRTTVAEVRTTEEFNARLGALGLPPMDQLFARPVFALDYSTDAANDEAVESVRQVLAS
jgi:hypothetical protein